MAENQKSKTVRKTAKSAKNTRAEAKKNEGMIRGISMLVSMAVSIMLVIFMYIDSGNGSGGIVNGAVKNLLMGLFGNTAYIVPVISVISTGYFMRRKDLKKFKIKTFLMFLMIVILSAVVHLMSRDIINVAEAYDMGIQGVGGGLLGAAVAYVMYMLFRRTASIILLFFILIVLVSVAMRVSIFNIVGSFFKGLFYDVKDEAEDIRKIDVSETAVNMKKEHNSRREERRALKEQKIQSSLIDIPLENASSDSVGLPEQSAQSVDVDMPNRKNKKQSGKSIGRNGDSAVMIDIPLDEPAESRAHITQSQMNEVSVGVNGNTAVTESDNNSVSGIAVEKDCSAVYEAAENQSNDDIINNINDIINSIEDIDSAIQSDTEDIDLSQNYDLRQNAEEELGDNNSYNIEENNFNDEDKETGDSIFDCKPTDTFFENIDGANRGLDREKKISEEEKTVLHNEIENALEIKHEYVYPSVDFLTVPNNVQTDTRQEMRETASHLIEILKNFGVEAKLTQVTKGPSVTRYEIQPSIGTKLSKISGLADDIALNLAAQTVLIAPVPGKTAIGIEVPNREVAPVYVRELIESDEFQKAKSKLSVVLGKDIGGRAVVGDIAKMPHALIAGATGSGKSVCINTIITSILYKASPDEVKLIMIDPKVVELGVYNGIPHLLIPVVTDPKKAAGALAWAVEQMMRRYDMFAELSVKNLEGYNNLMEKEGGDKLPQIVIIIDELADLMMVAAKEVEDYICRLAQLARAAGIHLIIATQRPSVNVITGLIKANVPSRIAFAVSSQVDSRTILDKAGADKLLGKGDMLYAPMGARSPLRVQGAFVTDGEIEKIVTFLKETSEENSYSTDLEEEIERRAAGDNAVTPDQEDDGDALLSQAIELAVSMGQISTSMIQRKFRIGYARAGRIIDQMEKRGVISGPNGSKPRDVIINRSEIGM